MIISFFISHANAFFELIFLSATVKLFHNIHPEYFNDFFPYAEVRGAGDLNFDS